MASKLPIRRAQVHVPDTCSFCESERDVNWYCNDCMEALCDRCKDGHKRAKKTRNDDVVPIKNADRRGEDVVTEVCKTHRGKTCDLYCCDCNIVMCAMCFTEKHKHHTFKNIEEEIGSQKQYMQDQLEGLKSKLGQLNNTLEKRDDASKSFKDNVDAVRECVETQRLKLKAEIDSIADSVLDELSSLVEEEENSHNMDCQFYNKYINEINQVIKDVEEKTEHMTSTSLLELTGRLRTTIPLYDVTVKTSSPCPPRFVTGDPKQDHLKIMFGYLQDDKLRKDDLVNKKKEIDSKQLRHVSTFRVIQQNNIKSICPIDDTHAWISVQGSTELIKVNKEGRITDSVKFDFKPWCLSLTNTDELLMTGSVYSPLVHKFSKDRRVTRFADISPLNALGITVSDSNEVFVTDRTAILVLNMSGEKIKQISIEDVGRSTVCLTTGDIVVTTGPDTVNCSEMVVVNKTGQIIHRWSGELDNGQKTEKMIQHCIARDRYDRVYVPDGFTQQVYVISGNERKARCLLDKKHGITEPVAVCVDRCGHVWIGCDGGTVHVMEV